MDYKNGLKIVLLTLIGIGLNFAGRTLSLNVALPFWVDTFGTILVAYKLGPVCGAIVGVSVNFMLGLTEPTSFYFCSTGILIGLTIGYISKKGVFDSYLRTIAWAYFITFAATLISIPYYWFMCNGMIDNVWGDGIADLLSERGVPKLVSLIIGSFYVEFLDKFFTIGSFFVILKIVKRINRKKFVSIVISILLMLSLTTPAFMGEAFAEGRSLNADDQLGDYDYYIQTVYNNLNGLPGGTANDIVHMGDGIVWIGTYAGLYRYNGTEFKHMNQYDTVKNVNQLYVDEEGRLWIATNDDGLSILINEEISNVLSEEEDLPSNSVRSVVQQSGGNYFVGTSDKLAIVTLTGGLRVANVIDEIVYAIHLAADSSNHVAAVTDAGCLYLVSDQTITDSKTESLNGGYYNSCYIDENNLLYAGTSKNSIEVYKIEGNKLKRVDTLSCDTLLRINEISHVGENLFVCADNGVGYFDKNYGFHIINTGEYKNSVQRMTEDYQGNIWFASSRQGLLKLCYSSFYDVYAKVGLESQVVNTINEWNNVIYFGTDTGLDSISRVSEQVVHTELNDLLKGSRVRCILVDSKNIMWICTAGKGIYEVRSDEEVIHHDSSDGMLGDKFRCAIELSNGEILFSGDAGITCHTSGNEGIKYTIGKEDGLINTKILCLIEGYNGEVLAGSDGGGIYVIKDGKVVKNLTRKDKLSSGVILRIVRDEQNKGMYIVTSNSICYMDASGAIRALSKFPYSNNYDIYDNGSGEIFVTSSAGIFVVNKDKLLRGGNVEYELLDSKRGLNVSLTANAWNYIDRNGNAYVGGGTGVTCFNIKNFDSSVRSYRMMIKSMTLDNVVHMIDKSSDIVIGRGVSKVSFVPEVINFSTSNPLVSYYLEGFDTEKVIVLQSELSEITYTNLPAGEYTFHLAVLDSSGAYPIEEMVYKIIKEKEIYDNSWFRDLFILETVIIVGVLVWFFTRTQALKTLEIQNKQLELAKEQVRMGDETIMAIARTVDAKDSNTSMHSTRVSEYSVLIAKCLGFNDDDCEQLRKIALLHDIGKIGVPDGVLNKPGRLTDEEYEIMKTHVVRGADILKDFSLVDHVAEGALYHHERYDGKGYVHGLKGEEIPLNARIIGIADSFDAMTANRVYRKKLPPEVVIEEIRKGKGTQFDPELVDIFLELLEKKIIDIDKIYEDGGAGDEA